MPRMLFVDFLLVWASSCNAFCQDSSPRNSPCLNIVWGVPSAWDQRVYVACLLLLVCFSCMCLFVGEQGWVHSGMCICAACSHLYVWCHSLYVCLSVYAYLSWMKSIWSRMLLKPGDGYPYVPWQPCCCSRLSGEPWHGCFVRTLGDQSICDKAGTQAPPGDGLNTASETYFMLSLTCWIHCATFSNHCATLITSLSLNW